MKKGPSQALEPFLGRRRADSNRRIRVLQTLALPLGHVARGTRGAIGPTARGAEDGIRTRDPLLGKEMLYH
jgi:hypothetical protein